MKLRHLATVLIGLLLVAVPLAGQDEGPPVVLPQAAPDGIRLRVDALEMEDFVRLTLACPQRLKPVGVAEPGYVTTFVIQSGDIYACRDGYLVVSGRDWNAPVPFELLRRYDTGENGLTGVMICPTPVRTGLAFYDSPGMHATCDEIPQP